MQKAIQQVDRMELERMDKNELFKRTGLPGEIDCALPQSFFDKQSEFLGENPLGHYVWWYPPGSCGGQPLSLITMVEIARLGRFVSFDYATTAVNALIEQQDRLHEAAVAADGTESGFERTARETVKQDNEEAKKHLQRYIPVLQGHAED